MAHFSLAKYNYRFLAKDSVKLGKAITLKELDTLLGSIIKLREKPGYSINPFYQLNKYDRRIDILNIELIEEFKNLLKDPNNSPNLQIIPFYQVLDSHYIEIDGDNLKSYQTTEDIISYLQRSISLDKESYDILQIIKRTNLIGELEGEDGIHNSLYNHLDIKVSFENNTYWLMNGNWYFLERRFMEDINTKFLEKITNEYNMDFTLDPINIWPSQDSEGEFNFGHNEIPNVFVLDKILYENIEICDLLILKQDEIYFIHVKNGLDGEVRVLSDQIENAMRVLNDAKTHDIGILDEYYQSIINKIKDSDTEIETDISVAARKFKDRFPNKESFANTINERNITFVFAYRPLDSHDFYRPQTIQSTAAKLSMLNLVKAKNNYDFGLEFLRINNTITSEKHPRESLVTSS